MVETLIKNSPKNQTKDTDVHILMQVGMLGLTPKGKNKNKNHITANKDFWQPPLKFFCNVILMDPQKETKAWLAMEE